MTTANLVIEVSQRGVKEADRALDELTQGSKRVETQTQLTKQALDDFGERLKTLPTPLNKAGDQTELLSRVLSKLESRLDALGKRVPKAKEGVEGLAEGANNATGRLGNLGYIAGQAGYQINDFVVQVQAGQSALIAMSQQGSQLIGAISPIGGALFAIGTVAASMLVPSLLDTKDAADELAKSMEELGKIQGLLDGDVGALTETMERYATISKDAANAQADLIRIKIADTIKETTDVFLENTETLPKMIDSYGMLTDMVSEYQKIMSESENGTLEYVNASNGLKIALNSLSESGADLAKQFNLTRDGGQRFLSIMSSLSKDKSPENIKRLSSELATLQQQSGNASNDFTIFVNKMLDASLQASDLEAALKTLNSALNNVGGGGAGNKIVAALQLQAATIHMTASEAALYRLEMEGASLEEVTAAKAALDTIDTYNAKQEAIKAASQAQAAASRESARAAEAAKRQAEQEQRLFERQQQQAAAYLEQIRRVNLSETELINQRYADRIAKLNEFYDLEAITVEQREAGRREAEIARQKEFGAIRQRELDQQIEREKEANEEKRRQQERLFDSSVSLLTLFGKEQSKAAKVALLTAQIYAQKDLIISQSKAVGKAFADGGLVGGLAALPAVLAQFAPLLATVASARAQGGTLSNGQVTRMNEREPELFAPNSNGMVFTGKMMQNMMNNAVQGGGGGARITVINNAAGVQHSVEQNGDEIRIVAERVFNERIDGGVSSVLSDPRSKASRALTTNYNAARKL